MFGEIAVVAVEIGVFSWYLDRNERNAARSSGDEDELVAGVATGRDMTFEGLEIIGVGGARPGPESVVVLSLDRDAVVNGALGAKPGIEMAPVNIDFRFIRGDNKEEADVATGFFSSREPMSLVRPTTSSGDHVATKADAVVSWAALGSLVMLEVWEIEERSADNGEINVRAWRSCHLCFCVDAWKKSPPDCVPVERIIEEGVVGEESILAAEASVSGARATSCSAQYTGVRPKRFFIRT